jgi:heme/copper-type cytochrome/quinol oxidase subunit 2
MIVRVHPMSSKMIAPLVLMLVVGLAAGYEAGTTISGTHVVTQSVTAIQTMTISPKVVPPAATVVNLDVVPDWGGATYDAFVIPSNVNGTLPKAGNNSTPPGPNDNNITVPAGVAVRFVITNLDTAVNMNFTGTASTGFTVYNDTASGYVALHYSKGHELPKLPVGHTFTIPSLNVSIPLPPDTVVTFTYTFTTPGVYEYMCETPCGLGMGLTGYMDGCVIATS